MALTYLVQWLLGIILILSSLGVILIKKPVHASLSFLLTLLMLSAFYLQLSAQFIAAMQILIYAGAILVIFMFVIILFQDAHLHIVQFKSLSAASLLIAAGILFTLTLGIIGISLIDIESEKEILPQNFGVVQSIGQLLYLDFFFPFEVIVLLFLIALIGVMYLGKKDKRPLA